MIESTANYLMINLLAKTRIQQRLQNDPDLHQNIIRFAPLLKKSDSLNTKLFTTYVFIWLDPEKIHDDEILQKMINFSKNIRNFGMLEHVKDERCSVFSTDIKAHKAILFCEVPFFRRQFQSSMKAIAKENVSYAWNKESLAFLIDHLEASDTERNNLYVNISAISAINAKNLLCIANYWGLEEVVDLCDRKLASSLINEKLCHSYESIDLSAFPYLRNRLFFCRYFAHVKKREKPFDHDIQILATNALKYNPKKREPKGKTIWINKTNREFLENVDMQAGLKIELDIKNVDKCDLQTLKSLARKFRSKYLLSSCFESEAKLYGIPTKRTVKKRICKYTEDRAIEIEFLPCPASGVRVYVEPVELSDNFFRLIREYPDLPLGLTLRLNQIPTIAESIKKGKVEQAFIKILNLENGTGCILEDDFTRILSWAKKLKVVVVPPHVKKRLPENIQKDLKKRSLTVWKNLHGTLEKWMRFNEEGQREELKKLPELYED